MSNNIKSVLHVIDEDNVEMTLSTRVIETARLLEICVRGQSIYLDDFSDIEATIAYMQQYMHNEKGL